MSLLFKRHQTSYPLSDQDAAHLIERFVKHYNTVRLHSAIGYVTPTDRLAGRHLADLLRARS